MNTTRLSSAIRASEQNGTANFLKHRNAVRKCLVRILAEIDNSDWTMADDHILDQIEHWLRDRMSDSPRSTFAPSSAYDRDEPSLPIAQGLHE
jgi:hypothetical protein